MRIRPWFILVSYFSVNSFTLNSFHGAQLQRVRASTVLSLKTKEAQTRPFGDGARPEGGGYAGGVAARDIQLQAFLLGVGDEGRTEAGISALPNTRAPDLTMEAKKSLGFSALSEKINGRLAIVGLVVGLVIEKLTGKSILQQFGFEPWEIELDVTFLLISLGVTLITLINHSFSSSSTSSSSRSSKQL